MPHTINTRLQTAPATSKELQLATDLSQAAVSRRLRAMGTQVVRIKRGRSVHYALTRNAFGAGNNLPLHRIDARGNRALVARLRPLAHGGFMLEPEARWGLHHVAARSHPIPFQYPILAATMACQRLCSARQGGWQRAFGRR